jgi:putative transposase
MKPTKGVSTPEANALKSESEPASQSRRAYFITAITWNRQPLFRHARWAELFVNTLFHYRSAEYLLHEFVVMPDHFHLLLTPHGALEKSLQFIKGGFSRRASTELESKIPIWQRGFAEHRIRDAADYASHKAYIDQNPVKARLADRMGMYRYSSAFGGRELDLWPQGLKPLS